MTEGVAYTVDEVDDFKAKIVAAMTEGFGMTFSGAVQAVQKIGGPSRSLAYEWRDADPDFESNIIKARKRSDENLIDLAESEMVARVRDRAHKDQGNMIRFCLRTKGKPRGYGDSTEITLPPTKEIDPAEFAKLTPEERHAKLREIAAQVPRG